MGPMVWRVIGTGSAVLAAAVAQKLVGKGWEFPTHPDESTWQEAVLFAALTGLVVNAARVIATRKAAEYYQKSAGHLPEAMRKS